MPCNNAYYVNEADTMTQAHFLQDSVYLRLPPLFSAYRKPFLCANPYAFTSPCFTARADAFEGPLSHAGELCESQSFHYDSIDLKL